jgi:hypothetical protein
MAQMVSDPTWSSLIDLFTTVMGREPQGCLIPTELRAGADSALRSAVPPPIPEYLDQVRIPDKLVEFLTIFGNEKAFRTQFYFIHNIDEVYISQMHAVVATNPYSAYSFGVHWNSYKYNFDIIDSTESELEDEVFYWNCYCICLCDFLKQVSSYNLLNFLNNSLCLIFKLKHLDSNTDFRRDMSGYRALGYKELDDPHDEDSPKIHYDVYYEAGTIIIIDVDDKSVIIGFDTVERRDQFMAKHTWANSENFDLG